MFSGGLGGSLDKTRRARRDCIGGTGVLSYRCPVRNPSITNNQPLYNTSRRLYSTQETSSSSVFASINPVKKSNSPPYYDRTS